MGYKLKSLVVENFVVFRDRTTIDFAQSDINLIEGLYLNNQTQSNGVGKSLILDGISLALFGKGIRANYISDYIPESNPNGGIYIGLEILDENNTCIKIERWKRPKSEVNKAKLWKNNVCISQDSTITKIDEAVQAIIGINHTNFLSCIFSVMIPGFTKLRPAQRFEILEHALAVKRIYSIIKKINLAIKTNEDTILSVNSVINDKTNRYIAEKTKKEIYSSNMDSIKENLTKLTTELIGFQEQEKEISTKIQETTEFIHNCNKQITPLEEEYKEFIAEKRAREVNKLGLETKKKAVLKSFRKNTKGVLECSICRSSLTEQSKDQVSSHFDIEIKELSTEIEELAIKINEKSLKINKFTNIHDQATSLYTKLSSSLSFIQTNMIALEKAVESNKASLASASSSFNIDMLISLEKELKELKNSVKETEKQLVINTAWKQVMSKNGLRLSYIKEEVSTLNALASRYATAIYETPMLINFFINDERDNPALDFTVNGMNAGMFSTGERGRLEIAMTLSLMSLLKTAGLSLSFIVLDEALDGLSASSKAAVLKVIDALALDNQVLMISHDPEIKNRQGHVIQITRDGNRSTVSCGIRKV